MAEYRVDQLAARAAASVDTVRFYQARGLLPPPRREGRLAYYSDDHVGRIERIRALQAKGFTLATIKRVLTGDLDAADEALVGALVEADDRGPGLTLDELASRSGIPAALLQAVVDEGILVRRADGRFSASDASAAEAGLRVLEVGLPVDELLALARRHHAAVLDVARDAIELFDRRVRQPLRHAGVADDEAAARMVDAFHELVPAATALVAHHFRAVLLAAAQERFE